MDRENIASAKKTSQTRYPSIAHHNPIGFFSRKLYKDNVMDMIVIIIYPKFQDICTDIFHIDVTKRSSTKDDNYLLLT